MSLLTEKTKAEWRKTFAANVISVHMNNSFPSEPLYGEIWFMDFYVPILILTEDGVLFDPKVSNHGQWHIKHYTEWVGDLSRYAHKYSFKMWEI